MVTLCIINHSSNTVEFYISLDHWPDNQNFIISALMQHISRYFLETGLHPSTLFLQLDNCAPTNKNRIMLAWLACLVRYRWFKEVRDSYLMEGHTHEDVDQVMAQLWRLINEGPIYTIDDYALGIEQQFARSNYGFRSVRVFHHTTCWDWFLWLDAFTYTAHGMDTCHGFHVFEYNSDTMSTIAVRARFLNGGVDQYTDPYKICEAFPASDMPPQVVLTSVFRQHVIAKLFDLFNDDWDDRPDAVTFWRGIHDDPTSFLQLNTPDNIVINTLTNFVTKLLAVYF